jgi:hypothetical protein
VTDADRGERAYLSRALPDGGAVEVEIESGSGRGEGAELVLVTTPDRVAGLRLADGKARLVGPPAPGTKAADAVLDPNLRTHRVVLQTDGARLIASIDGHTVGSASLSDVAAHYVGAGCVGAACRFTAWQVSGDLGPADRKALTAAAGR